MDAAGRGRRVRYAIVGTGSRAQMYLDAINGPHADVAELVAWSDTNEGRLDWYEARLQARGAGAPPRFAPDELGAAVVRYGVDRVIVTSPDWTHDRHIVAALEAGADAVVEKPLTTTPDGVRAIADAAKRTGRDVTVTFNYRYSPRNSALKRALSAGEIGEVTSVHFEWVLDTAHGADYFRRWHRDKDRSGGLLVHKASHHFDLVNWWLADTPTRVFASGGLRFYGAENAAQRGLGPRPARGSDDSPLRDAFSLDLRDDPDLRGLYLEQEAYDGYLRDRDVFDAGITIEDNLSLVVDYAAGASMSYALNAHAPWEGYTVAINGTRGRAELTVVERGEVLLGASGRPTAIVDPSARPDHVEGGAARPVGERLVVQNHFGRAREVPIPEGDGGHGGGDARLLAEVFRGATEDPLGHAATWRDGVAAVAVGLAGNRSLETRNAVRIDDLGLGLALVGDVSLAAPVRQEIDAVTH
ncbi:Gfo/Idh/MocA family oxidoreductase [Microbacterium sp. HD4P20]|uniref:Gfo/Idh/MocA family protein n=1 Tax=Microbacterium sp. HD4P20 TaxID=2864874 RepID=UPI001C644A9E|nr:Gfo/Idh/MocA family oxidoreductase [Microbacterium sp. HD4P20]MCP2635866.1 Gfo/Idh/MocA family oxidoreductase [Microbacterium sp. HD4P20]